MMHSLMMAGPDLRLRGELPLYGSLRFKRCFWEVGSFQLTVKRGTPGWDSLSRETLLYLPERPETALLAEKITVDEEKVTVSGVPLKGLCKRRICVPQSVQGDQYDGFGWDRFTGDAESAYLHYAAANLTDPEDAKRKIPGLVLSENRHRGAVLPWQARFDKLTEVFADIGSATGLGWDVVPDWKAGVLRFVVTEGVDRTIGSRRAVLSRRLGNVDGASWTEDGTAEVGTVYAGGSGEDENRLILSVGNTAEGLARREGWASLNGVSDVDMLRLGAERKLSPRKDSVTAELLDSGLCRYGRDYDLGDVVTVVADDRQMNARLTAVEETYEDGKRTLKATFGEGPVTLTGLIREKLRGNICLERREKMAKEFYGYFDSLVEDEREYDAAQFAHILRAGMGNGVTSHAGGGLQATAPGTGMTGAAVVLAR